jgi:catechol 2,3-dioxygenase-like lactoylglutathione lyase family enzyme
LKSTDKGKISMANYRRIDHVAINVSDLEASKKFYETHFGFKTYFEHGTPRGFNISYLKLGDTVLELVGYLPGAVVGFHFCLETDDFDGRRRRPRSCWRRSPTAAPRCGCARASRGDLAPGCVQGPGRRADRT